MRRESTLVIGVLKVLGRVLAIKFSTSVLLAGTGMDQQTNCCHFEAQEWTSLQRFLEGRRFNESMLKDLSSNAILTTRLPFKDSFQFQPTHTLWLYGNHLPRVSGGDSGVWRRLNLLPFDQVIPKSKIDKDIGKTLEAELPGIFSWALKGCQRVAEIWRQPTFAIPRGNHRLPVRHGCGRASSSTNKLSDGPSRMNARSSFRILDLRGLVWVNPELDQV